MHSGIGNSNKRKREDEGDDEDLGFLTARQLARTRRSDVHGLVQQSLTQLHHQQLHQQQQHQLLQSPRHPNNLGSGALIAAGNYPLLNPSAHTTLRTNLPLAAVAANRASSTPNPFAISLLQAQAVSQSLLGRYLDPTFSIQAAGTVGLTGILRNESAQLQALTQAPVLGMTAAQRGLMMRAPSLHAALPNVATQQASQLPNLPTSVDAPGSLALPDRFPTEQHQTAGKRGPSPAKDPPDTGTPLNSDLTGRAPVVLYMACDDAVISRYQCLARKQMELFEALGIDVEAGAQGRNRGIVMGQVGIRCRHCSHLYPRRRTKSSTFYPSKLKSIYQTAQNMANTHLTHTCQHIPQEIRDKLLKLSLDKKTSAGGGKEYWSDGARILGVYETETFLRFNSNPHDDSYPLAGRSTDHDDGSKVG